MNTRRFLPLLAVSLVLLLSVPAGAQELGFTCDMLPCQVACDEFIDVHVTIDAAVTDLRGASLVLEFDETLLTPVSVQLGDLYPSSGCPGVAFWLNQFAVGDSVAVDIAGTGCSVDGPGRILTVRFQALPLVLGTSPIRCRSSDLRNSLNQSIPHTRVDSTIEVVCPVPVESTTWGRVKRFLELGPVRP